MRQYGAKYDKSNYIRLIKLIIGLLITAIIFLTGYHYLSPHQGKKIDISSDEYRSLIMHMDTNTNQLDRLASLEKSINNHTGIYTTLALMYLAKTYVNIGQLEKAECFLERGLDTSQEINISTVIRLRLARVRLQQKKLDLAKKAIDPIDNNSWRAIRDNLLGDILLGQGLERDAYNVWKSSIIQNDLSSMNRLMQMKANNIS